MTKVIFWAYALYYYSNSNYKHIIIQRFKILIKKHIKDLHKKHEYL